MALYWLFYIYISNVLVILSAGDPSDSCEKTLSLCALNVEGDNAIKQSQRRLKGERGDIGLQGRPGPQGLPGLPGAHGEPGRPGLKGSNGRPGSIGLPGRKGLPGLKGLTGIKGEKGEWGDTGFKGLDGSSGPMGLRGFPGPPGSPGYPGLFGYKGEIGDMGKPGPIGPPGPPGNNGYCPCSYPEIPASTEFGDFENPAKVVCKAARVSVETGEYFIGPRIKVKCVRRHNTTTLTCIPPVSSTPKTYIYHQKTWLSQEGLTLEEIYGINRYQLAWLQNSSSSAYQTIRYHCLNSNPFPRDNVDKALLLLSWNDNTIGPMPTLTKPFFYTVPPEADGCSNATEDEWSSTDIKLVSTGIRRVPVIDFLVKDINYFGKTQSVKIEHVELCFD